MSDEGLHEIQLNGKQLVFLFMAATVVAVVIFLCGVMVGRGVPTHAASIDDPGQAVLDPTAVVQEPPPPRAIPGNGSAPATARETLTYPLLLEDPDPPAETLRPLAEPVADAPQPVVAPRPAAAVLPQPAARRLAPVAGGLQASGQGRANAAVAATPAAVAPPPAVAPPRDAAPSPVAAKPPAAAVALVTSAADVTLAEPPGTGFVVQVAAVRQRAEADTIARRLNTRGYRAFVTTAGANFRVRVGKYPDRREAESVAGRLEQEEKFKPWITR